jgi:RNA polymerase sigma-70 factor (ECF subfamily)
LNESQLIERVLTGEATAERALYEAHVDRIYRLAYRMTGDETMSEDCTQETFIRAFDNLPSFQGRSALSTWLHSIAVSVVLNSIRKVKRLRQRETELSEAVAGVTATPTADPDLRLRLHRAIDQLADDLRLVFVMHDMEGYKHQEIADILDVPLGTSKTRLYRAHQLLRDALAPSGGGTAKENGL